MKRKVHVYTKELTEDVLSLFQNLIDYNHVEQINDQMFVFTDDLYYEDNDLDYEGLYQLIFEDFSIRLTMMIEPYTETQLPVSLESTKHLATMPDGIYSYNEVLLEAILQKDKELINKLKAHMSLNLHQDVIHSVRSFVEHNMNSSVTAKSLFMHRNTLNYRIEQFVQITHIEVKQFVGAMVVFLLYRT